MPADGSGRVKQVILVRKDLRMRRGKEVAQGAHAAMAFLLRRLADAGDDAPALSEVERHWLAHGAAKVCLRVHSEEELLDCHQRACDAGLVSHLIRDSGRTEFGGVATLTACAIGPDQAGRIDPVTGTLEPY